MKTRIVFNPYKNGLKGLGLVKQEIKALGYKCVETKVVGSRYKKKAADKLFSWGIATNKIKQYCSFNFSEVPCPIWEQDKEQAILWINQGYKVVCRKIINGHGGGGIVVASTVEELIDAPLYTIYKPKKREFRVHTFSHGDYCELYVAEKKMRTKEERDKENFNKYIRNHENGWVFIKNPDDVPETVTKASASALAALGYKFGAVDIGWHPDSGVCVYEVNSACGADTTTAQWYAQQFTKGFN